MVGFIKPKFVLSSDGSLNLTNVPVPDNLTKGLFSSFIVTRFYRLKNMVEIGRSLNRQSRFSIFDIRFYEKNCIF